MRKFITWFFGLTALLILGAVGAYYLAKKYEEPVRNYIVGEVNKRLQSPVHVSDINFSFLERFPSASLVMDSVWAEENIIKIGDPDTLFFFSKVYLNLNVFDIIDGQYKINEIETRDGFMNLFVDEKGYDNFHIWVKNQDTTGFLLELDKVHVENTFLSYRNLSREQEYFMLADDVDFKGRFSDESYTMSVAGDGFVTDIVIKGTSYLRNRVVNVRTEMDIINSEEHYVFREGELKIDNLLEFEVTGELKGQGADLHVIGHDLDIIKSLALIPQESRTSLDAYSSSGTLSFECNLEGAFGRTTNPSFQANFSVNNASISKEGTNWKLSNLTGSGSIDNGSKRNFATSSVSVSDLNGQLNGDAFTTSFTYRNFTQPELSGDINLRTDIGATKEFFGIEWIEQGSGMLTLDASISTILQNPDKPEARDFLNSQASGTISIRDATMKLKDDVRNYSFDSAKLIIVNNALDIQYYSGKINSCQMDLQGRATGFLDYFFSENGKVQVNGSIQAGDINLEELFPTRNKASAEESSVVVAFPSRASWNLDFEAETFKNGKLVATDVVGQLRMSSFKVEAVNLEFNSQRGEVKGKAGLYRFSDNQYGLKTEFLTNQVDAKELFKTFNNFDQEYVISEVLEGKLDAEIRFQSFCDSLFNIDKQSIVCSADLLITEGELIGFSPLIDVAGKIRKRKLISLFVAEDELTNRLQHIEFDSLTNQISIRDGVISIPQMAVRSSAIDINISGTHSFEDEINYELDFALSEILELKNRKEPYNEYVQRDSKGNTRIYLTVKGTVDDFDVDLKKSELRKSVQDQISTETKTVKGLLNEEFGIFDNDSILHVEEEPTELKIEFNPEAGTEAADDTLTKDAASPTEEKKLLNRLIKKTESDKKKLKDGDFEDDDF